MSGSILKDVGPIIDESLGLKGCGIGKEPHYYHKASCQRLTTSTSVTFDVEALLGKIYEKILSNWNNGIHYRASKQNWRFERFTNIGGTNEDPEIKLERAIVRAQTTSKSNWANQVPTSSGFLGRHADKHRNIDLIYRCEDGAYELIELKVETNTPLYAAMEILQNAVLYIFYRENKAKLEGKEANKKPILDATVIHLRVLAPRSYYEGYELAWLEASICTGLATFLKNRIHDLQMDFRFEAFPLWFTADKARAICNVMTEDQADSIRRAVNDRKPIYAL